PAERRPVLVGRCVGGGAGCGRGERGQARPFADLLVDLLEDAAALVRGGDVAELVVVGEQHQTGAGDAEQLLGLVDDALQGLRQPVVVELCSLQVLDAFGQCPRVDGHHALLGPTSRELSRRPRRPAKARRPDTLTYRPRDGKGTVGLCRRRPTVAPRHKVPRWKGGVSALPPLRIAAVRVLKPPSRIARRLRWPTTRSRPA